jgi:hypothetical protein
MSARSLVRLLEPVTDIEIATSVRNAFVRDSDYRLQVSIANGLDKPTIEARLSHFPFIDRTGTRYQ